MHPVSIRVFPLKCMNYWMLQYSSHGRGNPQGSGRTNLRYVLYSVRVCILYEESHRFPRGTHVKRSICCQCVHSMYPHSFIFRLCQLTKG
jgi:hypothetical protein